MEWKALGRAVVTRRVQLGIDTRQALAVAARMSERLLSDIEKARRESYDPSTLARLEQTLEWEPGTVQRILKGDSPAGRTPADDDPDPLDRKLQRLENCAFGLNPTDLRTLNVMVQVAIEWAAPRVGRPEPTEDQVAAKEFMQRLTRDLARQQEANGGPREPRHEPAMREKSVDR